MSISQRFYKITDVLPHSKLMAEIGCDHAWLTYLAFEKGKCESAIVSDISEACLEKAKKTLHGNEKVTFLVGDGIVTDGRNPDCLLICGMGGHTICDILSRYNGDATLVISPQSHCELLRELLAKKSYIIEYDECFMSDDKYYDVIKAVKGKQTSLTDLQKEFGVFYKNKNIVLRQRLENILSNIVKGGSKNSERIKRIEEVLKWQR